MCLIPIQINKTEQRHLFFVSISE